MPYMRGMYIGTRHLTTAMMQTNIKMEWHCKTLRHTSSILKVHTEPDEWLAYRS